MKNLIFWLFIFLVQTLAASQWPQVIDEILAASGTYSEKRIFGGASNINYHIRFNEKDFFVRVAPKGLESLYSDPMIEKEVLEKLAPYEVSPKPYYYDAERKVLVTDYIFHEDEATDLLDPHTRQKVFALLHIIEESGIEISRTFCPYNDVLQLVKTAHSLNCADFPDAFYQKLLPTLKRIDAILSKNKKKMVCHLDLHHLNLLKNGDRYWIVDWEYAAMSHPFLVLASMAAIEHWDDAQMQKFVIEYTNRQDPFDFHYLYLFRIVADIFWTAWNHVQGHYSPIERPYFEWESMFYHASLKRIISKKFLEAISYLEKNV